jgi:hypothetical protein
MKTLKLLAFCTALFLVTGCTDDDGGGLEQAPPAEPEFLPIANPQVSLPPDIGAPFTLNAVDLAAEGFEEREYFVAGTASAFTNLSELTNDGLWEVEPGEQADYTIRVLVRRPISAAAYNGSVLVEWMNVTAGFETTPEWDNAHVEILRQGYAWIGVTAQFVGVYGSERSFIPFDLKSFNPERYETLEHPGDSFSYDIFSQVAQAVRNPGATDILNGLGAERIIGSGESQSASRLTTYVNAIHPLYNPFDGYIIHARGERASWLAQSPQTEILAPAPVFIRTDLNVPVLTFQSETEVPSSGFFNSVAIRQDDTDMFRLWEVAGTAHSDTYASSAGWSDTGVDPSFTAVIEENSVQGFIECGLPMNSGHLHFVFKAGLAAMNQWITDGTAPASGDYLAVSDDLSSFVLDDQGNVLGGIRTPYVDAPAAILSGLGQSGESFCGLFGTTQLFSAEQMASLYVDQAGYVAAVTEAANAAVAAGFLLQADADLIIAWAPEQWASQTGQ